MWKAPDLVFTYYPEIVAEWSVMAHQGTIKGVPEKSPPFCHNKISTGKGEAFMLVLSRGIGESIIIGDDVKITILKINHGQVKIGIEAPREIAVHREEVYNQIQEESKT